MAASLLFRELRFYLTRTLSPEAKAELKQLIEQNGGQVMSTLADATQIVDCERLDARHPEWLSTEFITDSVAFRALQDPSKYSGSIFTTEHNASRSKRPRIKYTLEEDARMLHFAKLRGWKSMDSVPESAWRLAKEDNVTNHTAQSMHEHFRKQLQNKTPMEQRLIMAKAAAMARARLMEQEEEKVEPLMQSRRTPNSATPPERATPEFSTVETRLREVEREKFGARERRARSRKPTSPLRISRRLHRSEGPVFDEAPASPPPANVTTPRVSATPTTPRVSATPTTPATSEAPVFPASPAHSSTKGSLSAGKRQQKRKRRTPSSVATNSREASPLRSESVDNDDESTGSKTDEVHGTFFRSVWIDLVEDSSKRRILQRFFEPPSASMPPVEARNAQSVGSDVERSTTTPVGDRNGEGDEERQQAETIQVEQATDEETDKIIRRLQFETQQDMPAVVHALYYCSGDVEMAELFLKGASPSEMWSPDDDLLLVNLVAEDGTNRATVDAAVNRGDFTAMQVSRDTDTILKRVQFLR